MYKEIKYMPAGDSSLVMEFGNSIDPDINGKISDMLMRIEENIIDGISEMIPTYRSILIIYNPLLITYNELVDYLKETSSKSSFSKKHQARIIEIPTIYGGEYGPDINFVAEQNNLTLEEVINLHSSIDYLVYMLGFTPGFAYLGGMDKRIETPRLKIPRTNIPAGSVGIAGNQTGIYSIKSPGGWQLIGKTPVKLYDPRAKLPILLNAGDYLRFTRVSENEYLKIEELIKYNEYTVKISKRGDINGNY